jgi:hypothetical protein
VQKKKTSSNAVFKMSIVEKKVHYYIYVL